ncbi:MAG: phage baseplate assembly protein V [Chloroflexota bacterium]
MMRELAKFLAPIHRRVRLMISRGVLALVNDALKMQSVQVQLLSGETREMERFQNYGFSSVPHKGAEAVAAFVGGSRDHGIVIVIDDRRYRLTGLQAGEVAIYTDEGDKIVFQRGRVIEITAGTKIRMVTPLLECTGEIKDRCNSDGRTMEDMRNIYDGHTHPGDSGGTTGAPNQVM